MKTSLSMAAILAGIALAHTAIRADAAALTPVATAADFAATDTVLYDGLGPDYTQWVSPFSIPTTSTANAATFLVTPGPAERQTEGVGYFGNFPYDEPLIYSGVNAHSVEVVFDTPVAAVGLAFEHAAFGTFTGTLEFFDAADASLGSFTGVGDTEYFSGEPLFLGAQSSALNIKRVRISTVGDDPSGVDNGLALGRLLLNSTVQNNPPLPSKSVEIPGFGRHVGQTFEVILDPGANQVAVRDKASGVVQATYDFSKVGVFACLGGGGLVNADGQVVDIALSPCGNVAVLLVNAAPTTALNNVPASGRQVALFYLIHSPFCGNDFITGGFYLTALNNQRLGGSFIKVWDGLTSGNAIETTADGDIVATGEGVLQGGDAYPGGGVAGPMRVKIGLSFSPVPRLRPNGGVLSRGQGIIVEAPMP